MNKTSKILLAVGAVIIIAGSTWLVVGMNNQSNNTTTKNDQSTPENQSEQPSSEQSSSENTAAAITYNGTAFEPASIEVKSGSSIKITNNSSSEIEFASDPHPTHTINPELNTSDIEPGASQTITVTKTGTWGYHNHYDPSKRGTIIVK